MPRNLQQEFTDAYLHTALWSSVDDDGAPLDSSYSVDDLAPEALAAMQADCAAFYAAHSDLFTDENCLRPDPEPDFGIEGRAGHDFWLTRNGHGAGFWDGDWTEPAATTLTDAAHAAGECNLYVSDAGHLYLA